MTQTAHTLPKIVVSGRIFEDQLAELAKRYEVVSNQDGGLWTSEQLTEHMKDAVGAIVLLADKVTKEMLVQCPKMKVICNIAVGFNNIDVAACTELGIVCTNTPDVLTESTADLGFSLMMAAARRITEGERFVRDDKWKGLLPLDAMNGTDLYGATLGIIGMGRIGRAVARRGVLGFNMKLVYHNRSQLEPSVEQELNATYASKDEVLEQADHVVLVMPYTPDNHHMIGEREFKLMKPTATLTNIARGGIVDENALADALENGQIAAAGLDVFEGEPVINPRLLEQRHIVMTPHIGSASTPTRRAMCQLSIDNLNSVLAGQAAKTPVN